MPASARYFWRRIGSALAMVWDQWAANLPRLQARPDLTACVGSTAAASSKGLMPGSAPASAYNKDNPFGAKIIENRLLSKPGSGKETRHFVVDITGSGMTYKAGDSLGVLASNRPSEIDEILRHLDATGDEAVEPVALRGTTSISLRAALTHKLSLAKPTRHFVEVLAAAATEPAEKAKLLGLLTPESKELLTGFLEARECVD